MGSKVASGFHLLSGISEACGSMVAVGGTEHNLMDTSERDAVDRAHVFGRIIDRRVEVARRMLCRARRYGLTVLIGHGLCAYFFDVKEM